MLILIAGVFSFAPAARADDAYSEFDFMIVIDRSGSMLRTDPDYVVTEAAKMFIDACEPSGSRVSVMTFNTKADHSGFIALDSVANKRHVKRIIDNIKYPKSAGSDMGEALLAASEYLQQNGATEE